MYLRGILRNLAPLIILTACITVTISTAHPLPSVVANALKASQTLIRRANHVTLSGMTLRGSQSLTLILPIQIAASHFESLYANLYHTAISELYANYLGSSSFTLRYNTFEISFVASSSSGVSVEQQQAMMIPWDFVRDFAVMMRVMSLRGYTGCYDQGYWNEVGNFGIYVGLRILTPPL